MADQNKETFRDSIGTIDESGHRKFIYPKKPSGRYYRWRSIVSWFLLAFLFIAPFIKVNGIQFMLFNVLERKFNIFGFPFFPQDFHLFALSIGLSVVFIILFTVVFGRIFCGWMCPQTIFMEMVFRKIEYLIEGDRSQQLKLARQSWNKEKVFKKTLKWGVFYLVSFFIANIFLSYLIGSDQLLLYIREGIGAHLRTFIILLVFTTVFYFVFAWFREQACIIVCPYGRLQGVLLDNNSINVAYDFVRGEGENGRAKFRKKEDRDALGYGDCIDCRQCVAVCPTGIDIRNGTQLECINCTACVDACDAMMEKVDKPKGLIRYASENNIEFGKEFKFTRRLWFYTIVLVAVMSVLIGLLVLRGNVETIMLRVPGQSYIIENDVIKNAFQYKVINKSTEVLEDISFKILSHEGSIVDANKNADVPVQGQLEGLVFIELKKSELSSAKERLKIGAYSGDELIETFSVNFQGPMIIK
ncbi:MAG: cytochrome c oxidase accessory protein CcoG [Flavobacteriia bacterium]|nr:MAG: cytochrome c oxidase accessory protein CcoG [Flavobacteriia bacterium]